MTYFKKIRRIVILLLVVLGTASPLALGSVNEAIAMDLCVGIDISVNVYDITAEQSIGDYSATDFNDYEITIPYNHVIKYTFSTSGTPSFTSGKFYQSGSYTYDQHTWSPNPASGMTPDFTAPALTANAFFRAQAVENVCQDNPPNMGDDSASVNLNITVIGSTGGGNPTTITKTGTASMAVYGSPSVALLIDGASTKTVATGGTATLSWATKFVNQGSSCTTSNNDLDAGNNPNSGWNGSKNGPGGGSQSITFSRSGLYTYSIYCLGAGNRRSQTASITVSVGGGPYFTCTANSSASVEAGSDVYVWINVNSQNGYNKNVQFKLESIIFSGGTASNYPSFGFTYMNPNVSPYDTPTYGLISTKRSAGASNNTDIGTYTFKFSDTSGSVTCSTTIEVYKKDVSADIDCDSTDGPCTVDSGQSSNISWSSKNSGTCTIYRRDFSGGFGVWQVWYENASTGSSSSGSIVKDTEFKIVCTDSYGISGEPGGSDTVLVSVRSENNPPKGVVTSNSACGKISVSWEFPTDSKQQSFSIYRKEGIANEYSLIASNISKSDLKYDDTTVSNGGSYTYAVRAVYAGGSISEYASQANPAITPVECRPSLAGSDKDMVSVVRGNRPLNTTFAGRECNNNSESYADMGEVPILPTGEVYRVGDVLTFKICVNNNNIGTENLTNVQVTELVGDAKYHIGNLSDIKFDTSDYDSMCEGGVNGNTWSVGNLADGSSCRIRVTAVIKDPGGAAGLYRFQNAINIKAVGEDSGERVERTLYIPSQVFSVGAGNPIRNETAP